MPDLTPPPSTHPAKAPVSSRLQINGLFLLGLAALGFLLVPHAQEAHLAGTWFIIGWPLPTTDMKVGMVTFPGPWGLHPVFEWFGLMNVGVWLAILLGVRRLARGERTPEAILVVTRILIVIAAYASAIWLSYGIANVLDCLARKQG